jgi:TatD DNase family protein
VSLVPMPERLPLPVVDTHTHLGMRRGPDDPGLSVAEALERAAAVNVAGVVQVGVDVNTSREAAQLAAEDVDVAAAVALHPNEVPDLAATGSLDDALREIDRLASLGSVAAVGETGLDHYRTAAEHWQAQEEAFRAHVEIARARDLAVVIHDRDAHDAVVAVLESMPTPDRVVFHCFSGDVDLAHTCARHGWFMSFAGTVTFRNAQPLREALAAAPPELVLVETDSPYLTPHPYRGRVNSSFAVPYTVRALAEVTGRDLDETCRQLAQATSDAFGVNV